ncbi:MAG: T9SS type A sorting domain-containing protein [Saprospiraceae bacterium]|nr:T9SS type A sorting domain-containing protein [Saprospiraceae bacterium]
MSDGGGSDDEEMFELEFPTSTVVQQEQGQPIHFNTAAQADGFALKPNPANDVVTLVSTFSGEASVEIFDLSGKQVAQHRFTEGDLMELDVSRLLPGVYLVALQSAGKASTQKLVIQR